MNTIRIYKIMVAAVLLGMASMSLAEEGTWTRKADMPTARIIPCTSVVNGKIYVIGGGRNIAGGYFSTVEEYDPATDTWTRKANMPTVRNGHATSVINGKIYVIGGEPSAQASISTVEEYDPATDTWMRKADMPTRRTFLCTCVVNGKIYAIGGLIAGAPNNPNWDTRAMEEYDPSTDTWTRMADMLTARGAAAACVVDGKIYLIGGTIGGLHESPTSNVEEYDPMADTWTRKANMPTARMFLSTTVVDGKIYAIGGGVWNGSIFSKVEKYDPATDTWTTEPDMPTRRIMLSTSVVNGKIYAIGGSMQWYPCPGISTVEQYDTGLTISSPDFNGDGIVDSTDICIMVDHWHTDYPLCDIAPPPFGDGIIDVQDLILLSEHLFEDYRMVAHWKMDETEGMIAHDDVGDCDGTCYGEPLWQPADGKVAGALDFDGMNDYVVTDFIQNPEDGSFSAFVWIKGGAPGQVILSQANRHVGRTIIPGSTWLGTDPSNGRLVTTLMDQPFGPLESQTIITDGQWHHIGLVYALDGLQRRLYVDGVEVAGDTAFVDGVLSDSGLHFGADNNLSATSLWSGLIDDIRIYPMALSAEEISALAR